MLKLMSFEWLTDKNIRVYINISVTLDLGTSSYCNKIPWVMKLNFASRIGWIFHDLDNARSNVTVFHEISVLNEY